MITACKCRTVLYQNKCILSKQMVSPLHQPAELEIITWKRPMTSENVLLLSKVILTSINLSLMLEAVTRRCSVKTLFLKTSQNSQENTCTRVFFLINLQASCEIFKNSLFYRTALVAASVMSLKFVSN